MDSTSNGSVVITEDPPQDSLPAPAHRQLDPIDQPPRMLGPKRSALLDQRRRCMLASRVSGLINACKSLQTQVLTSSDGILEFVVIRMSDGLLLERRHWPAAGLRTAQTMVFDNAKAFDRWCDTEPVRFNDPQLHMQLRREGHEVLDGLR